MLYICKHVGGMRYVRLVLTLTSTDTCNCSLYVLFIGWWFVNCIEDLTEGWVPANFLEPVDKSVEEENSTEILEKGVSPHSTNLLLIY